MTDSEKKTLPQTLRTAWLGALGAISAAEEELMRAAQRALGTPGAAGDADARRLAGELVERVRLNRAALERRIDEAVQTAVGRVVGPLTQQLANLRGRIERLQGRLDALQRRRDHSSDDVTNG